MQEKEVDFIPSNDFSFYDNFLDAAVLFNIIPERYRELYEQITGEKFTVSGNEDIEQRIEKNVLNYLSK